MPEIQDYHYEGSLHDDPKTRLHTLITKLGPRKMGGLVATLVVAVMLPVTLIAVQMQQNFRQRAATMPITSPISITSVPTTTPQLTPPPTGSIITPTSTPKLTPTATPTPSLYMLTGVIFVDSNRNGIKDMYESNYLYGATLTLSNGQKITTDIYGGYKFSNLPLGSYKVYLNLPTAYSSTTSNPITLYITKYVTYNFGIAPLPTSTPTPRPTSTPIPTATPIPTPPSAPAGLYATCSANGQLTFQWYATLGYTYAIRIDDLQNGWTGYTVQPGDTVIDNTSMPYTRAGVAGHQYSWWLHAVNKGLMGSATLGNTVTCPAPTAAPTPVVYSCQRCSNTYGCALATFQGADASCGNPVGAVNYTANASCPWITGGSDNSRCANNCSRCSNTRGCARAYFQGIDSSCINPVSGTVVYQRDYSCPQIPGGDNILCQ